MNATAFAPRPVRAAADTQEFAVTLDARHPFLDHHRPGGAPLFGTAMNIEVMVAAARAARPDRPVLAIEQVEIAAPCVLHDDGPAVVAVRTRTAEDGARIACTVVSAAPDAEVLHARGTVRLGPVGGAAPRAGAAPGPVAAAAPAAAVYRLFFHGPALQVIAGAVLRDGAMICAFAHAPGHHDAAAMRLHAGPRVIEFCLQTAGLLELATSGRMMIPHRIGAISPLVADADLAGGLVAIARRCAGARGDSAGIDIALSAAGVTLLRVAAYGTLPLPFATDAEAQATLRRALCGAGCGTMPRCTPGDGGNGNLSE